MEIEIESRISDETTYNIQTYTARISVSLWNHFSGPKIADSPLFTWCTNVWSQMKLQNRNMKS